MIFRLVSSFAVLFASISGQAVAQNAKEILADGGPDVSAAYGCVGCKTQASGVILALENAPSDSPTAYRTAEAFANGRCGKCLADSDLEPVCLELDQYRCTLSGDLGSLYPTPDPCKAFITGAPGENCEPVDGSCNSFYAGLCKGNAAAQKELLENPLTKGVTAIYRTAEVVATGNCGTNCLESDDLKALCNALHQYRCTLSGDLGSLYPTPDSCKPFLTGSPTDNCDPPADGSCWPFAVKLCRGQAAVQKGILDEAKGGATKPYLVFASWINESRCTNVCLPEDDLKPLCNSLFEYKCTLGGDLTAYPSPKPCKQFEEDPDGDCPCGLQAACRNVATYVIEYYTGIPHSVIIDAVGKVVGIAEDEREEFEAKFKEALNLIKQCWGCMANLLQSSLCKALETAAEALGVEMPVECKAL